MTESEEPQRARHAVRRSSWVPSAIAVVCFSAIIFFTGWYFGHQGIEVVTSYIPGPTATVTVTEPAPEPATVTITSAPTASARRS